MPPRYPDVRLKRTAPINESGRTHSTRDINSFVRYVTVFKPGRTHSSSTTMRSSRFEDIIYGIHNIMAPQYLVPIYM